MGTTAALHVSQPEKMKVIKPAMNTGTIKVANETLTGLSSQRICQSHTNNFTSFVVVVELLDSTFSNCSTCSLVFVLFYRFLWFLMSCWIWCWQFGRQIHAISYNDNTAWMFVLVHGV